MKECDGFYLNWEYHSNKIEEKLAYDQGQPHQIYQDWVIYHTNQDLSNFLAVNS